jgi:type I restriction enzyme R subunit
MKPLAHCFKHEDSFDARGGLGKMYQIFGPRMEELIEELNEELTA